MFSSSSRASRQGPASSAAARTSFGAARPDAAATAAPGSSTIADNAAVATDPGRSVTGTGIPAGAFVGTVTDTPVNATAPNQSGFVDVGSFTLVDASGHLLQTTGAVSGVVLGARTAASDPLYDARDATTGGGDTGSVLISPYIRPGTTSTVFYNHYSWLRTIEDLFNVSRVSKGLDGEGHIGYAAQPGLAPFGADVFNHPARPADAAIRQVRPYPQLAAEIQHLCAPDPPGHHHPHGAHDPRRHRRSQRPWRPGTRDSGRAERAARRPGPDPRDDPVHIYPRIDRGIRADAAQRRSVHTRRSVRSRSPSSRDRDRRRPATPTAPAGPDDIADHARRTPDRQRQPRVGHERPATNRRLGLQRRDRLTGREGLIQARVAQHERFPESIRPGLARGRSLLASAFAQKQASRSAGSDTRSAARGADQPHGRFRHDQPQAATQ